MIFSLNKKLRLLLIGFGISVGLTMLVVILTLFVLETDMAQQYIQTKINEHIPGKLSWKHFCLSLISGRVEISDAALKGPSDEELISFERLYLHLSIKELLNRNISVYRLTLNRPKVILRTDHEGKLNLLSAFRHSPNKVESQKHSSGIPFNISADEIEILNGFVSYESEKHNFRSELDNIRLIGNGNLADQSADLMLTVGKGNANIPRIMPQLRSFKAKAGMKQGHIEPIEVSLAINTDAGNLNLNGGIHLQDAFPEGFFSSRRNPEAIAYNFTVNARDILLDQLSAEKVRGNVNALLCLEGKGIFPQHLSAVAVSEAFADGLYGMGLKLRAEAGLKENVVNLAFLEAESGDLTLHAKGNYGISSEKINADLTLKASDLEKSLSPFGLRDIRGKTEAKVNLSGQIRKPIFDIALVGNNLQFRNIVIGDADIAAAIDTSGHLKVSRLLLQNQGAQIRGRGEIQVFKPDSGSDFSLSLSNVSLNNFIHKNIIRGIIDAELDVKGNLKKPDASLSLKGKNLESGHVNIGNIDLAADLNKNGELTISRLSLNNKGCEVKGKGKIHLLKDLKTLHPEMPINVSLDIKNAESKNFVGRELFDGSVDARIDAHGNLKSPEIALSLRGRNIAVKAQRLGDIEADMKFSQGEVFLSKGKILNHNSALDISGKASVTEKNSFRLLKSTMVDLVISGRQLMIEDFVKDFKGQLALNAQIKGNILNPAGNIRLEGKQIDTGFQKLSEIFLNAELMGDKIAIRSLNIAPVPGEHIEGSGWISFKKNYEIVLKSEGISLSAIDKFTRNDIAEGKITLNVSGKGSFDNPVITGNAALKELAVRGKKLDDIFLNIDLKDHTAKVRGRLDSDFAGSFNLLKKDFSATLNFDGANLTPYFDIAGQADLSGKLSGKIAVNGNAADIGRIRASADLSELMLFFREKEIIRSQDFRVSFANKEITIPSARLHVFQTGDVLISGKAAADGTGAVDIDIQHIGFAIHETAQNIHDLNGRIHITPDRISLEKIRGGLDSGNFEIGGSIALAEFKPVSADVEIRTDALPIKVPNMLEMLLTTRLKLSGKPEKSSLHGEATLIEGRYYRNVSLNFLQIVQSVKEKKREATEIRQHSELTQPFLRNMSLDISVKRKNPFMVENNIAKLEVHPDLRIYGTLNKPLMGGRADIASGTITYQKRKFDLKRGFIDFINPYKIEPTLDIEGSSEIRKWTVSLKVSGTPDKLSFKLSSNPSEEDGDILSLLLVGKTAKELIEKEGGNSQSPGILLAQMVAETFGEDFKKATGLDIFQVDFQDQDSKKGKNNSNGVKVTVGKELSRRMTVKYAVESSEGKAIQKAIAEYKFFENILVSAFQNTKGGFGGELQFRLEFR